MKMAWKLGLDSGCSGLGTAGSRVLPFKKSGLVNAYTVP